MRSVRWVMVAALAAVVSGCVTTEQASEAIQSRWVGQGADAFFQRYGAPRSEFPLSNGDVLYTWRGGETTKYIAATYAAPASMPTTPSTGFGTPAFGNSAFGGSTFGQAPAAPAAQPLYSREKVRTETQVENPSPGVTRTTTTTTTRSASIGLGSFGTSAPAQPAPAGRQMLTPARTEQLFCEVQLTVDNGNMIKALRITRDTAAAGIGLSRCAEVLEVKG